MDYRSKLLTLAAACSAGSGRSEARIANLAGCDSRFFVRLREGKGCTVDTLERVHRWFSANWPQDAPWPEGIDRPEVPVETAA